MEMSKCFLHLFPQPFFINIIFNPYCIIHKVSILFIIKVAGCDIDVLVKL